MRKEPEKYVKGGGLNPFWMEYEIERYSKENSNDYHDDNTDDNIMCEIIDLIDDYVNNYCDDNDDISYEDKLEADFQFLKRHSDSEEDLKLAKQILGIDTDD